MSSPSIFFRKLITSKRLRCLSTNPEIVCGSLLFLILIIHGATIGLTDDEAYYWVLAQKPALGYAYHPPMVAWVIAGAQFIFRGSSTAIVRFPAIFSAALVLVFTLQWLREVGVAREKVYSAASIIVSLAGLFALSWMIVPDLPMFLGWILMFRATWRICFGPSEKLAPSYILLFAASVLSLLSKYSAVLMFASSMAAVWSWAPRERRFKTLAVLFSGGLLAAVPIVLWNSTHEWASILYQIRDRHEGGSLSFVRWARFWVIELFGAGPFLLIYGFGILRRKWRDISLIERYVWVWAAPAVLVFGLQPLWSDFKPHWALVAWWPFVIALAWRFTKEGPEGRRLAVMQRWYGLSLGALVLLLCHVPLVNAFISQPKLDVSNDLYGWHLLKDYVIAIPGNEAMNLPVVGSRYQTASQAYFSLGPDARVTMLPRDLKARDEWPTLQVSDSEGPEWPTLTKSILFVGDNRYDAPPEFKGASCKKTPGVTEFRGGKLAKKIDVWRCDPITTMTTN
jgi:Dolichyl-phosphate-mannose-protein mannosyltransferase